MSYLDMFQSRLAIVVKYNGEITLDAKDAQEVGGVIGMHEAVFIVQRLPDGGLKVLKSRLDEAAPGQLLNFEQMYEIAAEHAKLARRGTLPTRRKGERSPRSE